MSRASKPHGGGRLAAVAPALIALTPDEADLLAAFRAMDLRAKSDVIELATLLAEANPYRTPALRLIVGGAQ